MEIVAHIFLYQYLYLACPTYFFQLNQRFLNTRKCAISNRTFAAVVSKLTVLIQWNFRFDTCMRSHYQPWLDTTRKLQQLQFCNCCQSCIITSLYDMSNSEWLEIVKHSPHLFKWKTVFGYKPVPINQVSGCLLGKFSLGVSIVTLFTTRKPVVTQRSD